MTIVDYDAIAARPFTRNQVASATERALSAVFGGPEIGVTEELLFMIEEGVLADSYGWPEIIQVEQEFPVPRGRVDLLLLHVDGSATVIECKASRSARDILPAVGQVMSYGVQLGYSRTLTSIRLAIASRASAIELRPIRPVLQQCRIEPVFCGMFSKVATAFAQGLSEYEGA